MITNLTRILTTRNAGQDTLQDLNYTFDTVGNITQITDDAQQTHYFNNQVVAATSNFEYDALYRLISATGRELTALTAPTHNDFVNNIYCPNPAANAMQNYNHSYSYDVLGNILQDAWKTYQYDTQTNYLLGNNNVANQYTYDQHGNMLTMPHLSAMIWNYKDELISATNGTFTSYYSYDNEGNRTRKVVVKGNITETRYYIGNYEIFRKKTNNVLDFERKTINISDDEKVFVRIEQKTGENEVIRYQYDNHLGSACLELDENGAIISYEEYHPFGTTSYRSGRSETEVSLKRYKYNGKERDEETGLYAYGMRYYAAWICRFVSCDPLQFKYPEYTPYNYCLNCPIKLIDPDGAEVINEHKTAHQQATDRVNNAQKALNTFGDDKKADGYKEAKKELKQAEKALANISLEYEQVESAIKDLKEFNPDLFNQLNSLTDDNGNSVDVYVAINTTMSDRGVFYDRFDEETQQFYSDHGFNTVQIDLNPGTFDNPNDLGEILSHEGGHAAYTVPYNSTYSNWLMKNVPDMRGYDAHGEGDLSGKAAKKQQEIYCKNKGIRITP